MPDEIVGDSEWVLRGTASQNAILRPVFTRGDASWIAFPWARITKLPTFPVPITWDDLNDGTLGERPGTVGHHRLRGETRAPLHEHIVDGHGNEGHAIRRPRGPHDARLMIAGVFWSDGHIKIDQSLEFRPLTAREVLSAEIAHAVDYGLPLTDAQKVALTAVLHPGGADEHTWWQRENYGTEYYTLVGEAWMALFTHAYSQMEPWQDPFVHKSARSMAPAVHNILGIAPVSATPPPPPPPPQPGGPMVTLIAPGIINVNSPSRSMIQFATNDGKPSALYVIGADGAHNIFAAKSFLQQRKDLPEQTNNWNTFADLALITPKPGTPPTLDWVAVIDGATYSGTAKRGQVGSSVQTFGGPLWNPPPAGATPTPIAEPAPITPDPQPKTDLSVTIYFKNVVRIDMFGRGNPKKILLQGSTGQIDLLPRMFRAAASTFWKWGAFGVFSPTELAPTVLGDFVMFSVEVIEQDDTSPSILVQRDPGWQSIALPPFGDYHGSTLGVQTS